MSDNFELVTEIEGQRISAEQLDRICHRYHWAASLSVGKDVLEVACGAGQGLKMLRSAASTLVAGDISEEVLRAARKTYGNTISFRQLDAENLPFNDNSFDVLLLFEALYYIPDVGRFLAEARRVLRPGGRLLIATANKDLFDFTPSPFSKRYLGVSELGSELAEAGFVYSFAGYIDARAVSLRQRLLRPIKLAASRVGLMPRTMHGKERLKKLFFGAMTVMPADVSTIAFTYEPAISIAPLTPDRVHKVIYCDAVLKK